MVALRRFIQDTVKATVHEVAVEATVNVSPVPNEINHSAATTASVSPAPNEINHSAATTASVSPVHNKLKHSATTTASPPVDTIIATASVDANTASMPVGSGGVAASSPAAIVHTQLHGNIRYDVPAPNASGPYYWVTCSRRVGIFSTWQQTSSHVIGVNQASFSKVHSLAEGMQLMNNAIDRGETELLI
ncbi:hypothetical protein EV702DRAFT_1042489 [Suillus placidus]|uniref:Ribonuclease H1 N-terminal domain-containing protein n=1 Tax=Suillus placidus TaxID=48579 RepID=A0A9P7A2R2_9AGAM|nr:hypothetical protein EV702DRAFT_1042489 [Suillus placidus]